MRKMEKKIIWIGREENLSELEKHGAIVKLEGTSVILEIPCETEETARKIYNRLKAVNE